MISFAIGSIVGFSGDKSGFTGAREYPLGDMSKLIGDREYPMLY